MKRIVAIALVLVMALSLCACDSMDYKKAVSALEAGDFTTAREMFVNLGDYENSAEMVKKCDYQQACAWMKEEKYTQAAELFAALGDYEDSAELAKDCNYFVACDREENGQYAQARELFISLGDYKDSAAKAILMAQNMFMEYVKGQELLQRNIQNGQATVMKYDDDSVLVAYVYKTTGMIAINLSIGLSFKADQQELLLVGNDELKTYAAHYTATANSVLNMESYVKEQVMAWDSFTVTGYNAYGEAYDQKNTWLDLFLTTGVNEIMTHIEEVLASEELGLTMADIGFANYQSTGDAKGE